MSKRRRGWSILSPRHNPTYGSTGNDHFLGYINELDVWFDPRETLVAVVGPDHRRLDPMSYHNFDTFSLTREGGIAPVGQQDVHMDLHETCLLYALCGEYDLFKEVKDEEE